MKLFLFRMFVLVVCGISASSVGVGLSAQEPLPEYEVVWLDSTQISTAININSAETVVGRIYDESGLSNAFRWTQSSGIENLNDAAFVPSGWHLLNAKGINDSGQIAGNAKNLTTGQVVAYRFDPTANAAEIMQYNGPEDHTVGWHDAINEFGDLLYHSDITDANGFPVGSNVYVDLVAGGLYHEVLEDLSGRSNSINNFRQVVGFGWRMTLGNTPEEPHQLERLEETDGIKNIRQINDAGFFASYISQKKRGRIVFTAVRFTNTIEVLATDATAKGINATTATSSGDIIGNYESSGRAFVFTDELGIVDLDDVISGSTNDVNLWNSAASISVNAISDRGSAGFGSICGSASFPDGNRSFVLMPIAPVPTAGISVSPTSGLVTTEGGGTASFTVVLDTQPTESVTIGISVSPSDAGEGTVDESSLTFIPAEWDIPQTVTVTGVDDNLADPANPADGDIAYTIITAAATSTDDDYAGLDADDVSVTNEDNDGLGGGSETYDATDIPQDGLEIPDNDPIGIDPPSTIFAGDHMITNLTVSLDITHPRPLDLEAYLIPDGGLPIRLPNLSGDNPVSGFAGTSSAGTWTLEVYDIKKRKTGTLNGWSITVDY